MKKILVAIDGSEDALKAVDYVGQQFAGLSDLRIVLFHVSPGIPPELWDDGHILTEKEKADRKKVLDKWLSNQKLQLESIFQPAVETLTKRGIEAKQIETKSASESVRNTPECILAEAKTGGYLTLVMGRCGLHRTAHALLGSTVSKIINHRAEIATCLVT
ncbi:MAG: universal stress protein [Thermodesulfobacteriota bacterium]